jgi:hypothetical protein
LQGLDDKFRFQANRVEDMGEQQLERSGFTGYREIAAPHLQRREGGASSSSLLSRGIELIGWAWTTQ